MIKSSKLSIFSFVLLMSLGSNLYAWDLSGLATPKSLAIIATTYGLSTAVSNFLWAFRWNKHAGVSDETSAKIQEAGGISAAIECLILGFMIPLIAYQYRKKHPTIAGTQA